MSSQKHRSFDEAQYICHIDNHLLFSIATNRDREGEGERESDRIYRKNPTTAAATTTNHSNDFERNFTFASLSLPHSTHALLSFDLFGFGSPFDLFVRTYVRSFVHSFVRWLACSLGSFVRTRIGRSNVALNGADMCMHNRHTIILFVRYSFSLLLYPPLSPSIYLSIYLSLRPSIQQQQQHTHVYRRAHIHSRTYTHTHRVRSFPLTTTHVNQRTQTTHSITARLYAVHV